MKKQLISIFLFLFPLCYIEAKQKSPFRFENDTILHICSNFSEMDSWIYYMSDESERPYEYFIFPYWRFKNLVIDEGVDSVYFGLNLISAKRLSIPSSLKYLYFSEVPPSLEEVRLNAKNPCFRWEDGTLYNRDKSQLYFMLPSSVDSVLYIPETVEQVWSIPDRYYQKGLSFRNWEGYPECSSKDIHYSKIVFPKHCKRYPEYHPSCDSLILLSDSAVAHSTMEALWGRECGYEKKFSCPNSRFHCPSGYVDCPNYDVRKRDTSWMRESYRLIYILDNGDTLVGVDTIPSGRYIKSAKIEGIADENVKFNKRYGEDVYRFYVATYDTLYRLPLEVFVKPEEKKPEPKWSDFGEVKDSVLTIREDVDSLPDLRGSFRKVIIPKRTHYLEGSIKCDSAYLYSDSLVTRWYYNVCDRIDANYYYVENEELYLSLKRRLMEKNQFQKSMEIRRPAVVYCPLADVRKRNMALQQNTNNPVWRDSEGNIKNLTYRPWGIMTGLQLEIEGLDSQDLYVLDCRRKCFLRKSNGYFGFINDGKTAELEYAVWSYDTLLPLQQKDTVRFVKRDGTPWGKGYDIKECVLYYVPKGMTRHTLLESKDSIMMWRSGDTIPRRYANRLAFGMLLTNGDCNPSGAMEYDVLYLDKRNQYLRNGHLEGNQQLWKIPRQYKKIWLHHIKEYSPDCLPRGYSSMHFYVGR